MRLCSLLDSKVAVSVLFRSQGCGHFQGKRRRRKVRGMCAGLHPATDDEADQRSDEQTDRDRDRQDERDQHPIGPFS